MKFRNPFDQADDKRRHAETVGLLKSILKNQEKIMDDLSKITADVDALTAAVATAITDLTALSADIAALKAAPPSSVQAGIDALDAKIQGITSNLVAGTTANPA